MFVIIVGRYPMAKSGIVSRALWRVKSWELEANGSIFLSLDTTPTGAEHSQGGLHAVAGSTDNDAVVAASARALQQFSNSCGVLKVKENLGKAISVSFSNNIALVPLDKLAGAETCLDQSHCVVD
jgi:hypothetical protein